MHHQEIQGVLWTCDDEGWNVMWVCMVFNLMVRERLCIWVDVNVCAKASYVFHVGIWLQATCCADKVHCCPHGYKCDTAAGTCVNGSLRVPFLNKLSSKRKTPEVRDIVCPDGKSTCGSDQTCCQMADGSYGCCDSWKVSIEDVGQSVNLLYTDCVPGIRVYLCNCIRGHIHVQTSTLCLGSKRTYAWKAQSKIYWFRNLSLNQ